MATCSSILAWRIPMDRGDWWATVHGVAKSQTRLSAHAHTHTHTRHYPSIPRVHLPRLRVCPHPRPPTVSPWPPILCLYTSEYIVDAYKCWNHTAFVLCQFLLLDIMSSRFTPVVAGIRIYCLFFFFFFLSAESYVIVWGDLIVFIHSSVDGHCGPFCWKRGVPQSLGLRPVPLSDQRWH